MGYATAWKEESEEHHLLSWVQFILCPFSFSCHIPLTSFGVDPVGIQVCLNPGKSQQLQWFQETQGFLQRLIRLREKASRGRDGRRRRHKDERDRVLMSG